MGIVDLIINDSPILVIDDLASMRKVLVKMLAQFGITNVVEAPAAEQALEKLRENQFSLVFSDWNMPGLNGIELVKIMRDSEDLKNIPVILITGFSDRDLVIEAARSGVSDFILKPFSKETVRAKMEKVLAPKSYEAREG